MSLLQLRRHNLLPHGEMEEVGVGIIGAGVRGAYCLGEAIADLNGEVRLVVAAVCDVIRKRSEEAKNHLEQLYAQRGRPRELKVYDDYRDMLEDEACKLVLVTSFTNQHKKHTVDALQKGKEVYLDKPIAVTLSDAAQIVDAARENPLVMGFTRRYESSWIKAKELLDSGIIGRLQMMQINSVIPYSRYLQTWHRKRELSGGALNDKSSHHFDVFNWMAGEAPAYLTAVGGRSSVFQVEEDAPASCRVCSRECPYRRDPNKLHDGAFVLGLDSWKNATDELDQIDTCVYAPGSDINDHAVVSVVYPSGVKASLFFSIFGPDTKDQETMTLVGDSGKITLVRHEGQVILHSEFGNKEEVFDCRGAEFHTSHFGADRELIRTLNSFLDGHEPVVTASDGYLSLEMVLAAQKSITNGGQPVRLGVSPAVRLN